MPHLVRQKIPKLFTFHLSRGLSLHYPPHQQLMSVLVVSFLLSVIYIMIATHAKLAVALLASVFFVVSLFLSWALAREFDPLHEYSAFWAILCTFPILWLGFPNLFILLFLLIFSRFINHSSSTQTSITDVVLFAFFAMVFIFQPMQLQLAEISTYTWILAVCLLFSTILSIFWSQEKTILNDEGKKVSAMRVFIANLLVAGTCIFYLVAVMQKPLDILPYLTMIFGVTLYHTMKFLKKALTQVD